MGITIIKMMMKTVIMISLTVQVLVKQGVTWFFFQNKINHVKKNLRTPTFQDMGNFNLITDK